jgi:basic membrane protein A
MRTEQIPDSRIGTHSAPRMAYCVLRTAISAICNTRYMTLGQSILFELLRGFRFFLLLLRAVAPLCERTPRQRLVLMLLFALAACGGAAAPATPSRRPKIGVMIDASTEKDKSFNEYTLKGARGAAEAAGLNFAYVGPQSASDYERTLENLIATESPDLVITVGFRMGDATARAARRHPSIKFAIVDNAYTPGAGCAYTVKDCYSAEGGLVNVTSLMFAEDQIGYLAGVLAGCMTRTGAIASVAGVEIPPVVRFVTGFQHGGRSVRPDIVTLNQYVPDFNDPDTGKVVAQGFIQKGADVIFGVGGNTGNGGLLAAKEAGLMAIGVDVDQYFTYPEVKDALLTSASKNVDIAAAQAVNDFVEGKLQSGIRFATLANGGVGLAPYHDWDSKIPQTCKDKVKAAEAAIKADPATTGAASVSGT